jgi:hypothetical protein
MRSYLFESTYLEVCDRQRNEGNALVFPSLALNAPPARHHTQQPPAPQPQPTTANHFNQLPSIRPATPQRLAIASLLTSLFPHSLTPYNHLLLPAGLAHLLLTRSSFDSACAF